MENSNFAEVGVRSIGSPHVLLDLTRFFTSNFGVRVKFALPTGIKSALGLPSKRAIQVTAAYGQKAVIEIVGGKVFILICKTPDRQSVGEFQTRLKHT